MKKYTVLDLFSGVGGLSKGFLDANYNVVLGVDFDEMALTTFKANHGTSDIMALDLFDHNNLNKIEGYFNKKNIKLDVLIGGPPCQGFSLAGPRIIDDKRNTLYKAMVKIAKRLIPKAVILENVPGLLQLNNGYGSQKIMEDFSNLNYTIVSKILYAPDFGIPQIRKRVFFVALYGNTKSFNFPNSILSKENYITCEEAISDLPPLNGILGDLIQNYSCQPKTEYQKVMRKNSQNIQNHIGTIHSDKTLKFISMIPEGKNYKSLPAQYSGIYKYHEALTRYHSKKPSLTINTGHRSHFHYKYNRIPTVRESARLQSFPDDFIFYGNKTQQYRQVGNAVPPLLGYHVANKLKEYLDRNYN